MRYTGLSIKSEIVLRLLVVTAVLAIALAPFLYKRTDAAGDMPASRIGKIRWGYYVAYDRSSYVSLQANIKNLDYVSTYWYHMDGDGNLITSGDYTVADKNKDAVIALARQNGVKILPMVKNSATYDEFHNVLTEPGVRSRAVQNIVNMVVSGNFDGVNVDFEGMNSQDRDGLTAFMAELYPILKLKGKIVTQAVAGKDQERATGWAGPYDYAALGKYNDLVLLMTYGYGTGKPQSTSPFPWVERTVAFASTQIPAHKLILGLAWYGYDWNISSGALTSLRHSETADLIDIYKPAIVYDSNVEAPNFRYVADGEQHEVWYEDKRSNEAKIELVSEYGLAGAGSWHIGHEDQEFWDVYNDRLGFRTWFLAEGATTPPFQTWVLLMNPNSYAVNARVTFMKERGETVAKQYKLPPTSRMNIFANQEVPNSAFSTKVEGDGPIFVERSMFFGQDAHTSSGINGPSRSWYLPQGNSTSGGDTWVLLMNPNSFNARIKVTFVTTGGTRKEKEYVMNPTSRLNIYADYEVPNTTFSTIVESDSPVIAETASYHWNSAGGMGGSGSPGTPYLSKKWYLAEGFTGHNTSLALMNPYQADATVKLTFMLEGSAPLVRQIAMGPSSRQSITVNNILPPNTAFSTMVESNIPIAAERTSLWGNNTYGHSSLAVSTPARVWYLPEGSTAPPFLDFVLIMNPNPESTKAVVTFMTEKGDAVVREYKLAPNSRFTLYVNSEVPNTALSTRVESELPVVVERSMYFGQGGASNYGVAQ
ncbi:MAG: hypothetical protein EXR50_06360 [Dehalococcoidia bacterium]|nr:hypothetical protein [Dehalococcoidia bacterium]